LKLVPGALAELRGFDDGAVRAELTQIRDYRAQFGECIRPEFQDELTRLAHEVAPSVRRHQDEPGGRRLPGADNTW